MPITAANGSDVGEAVLILTVQGVPEPPKDLFDSFNDGDITEGGDPYYDLLEAFSQTMRRCLKREIAFTSTAILVGLSVSK